MSVGLRRRKPLAPEAPGVGGYAELTCQRTLASGPCDDEDPCTRGDVCDAGACKSGAAACDVAVTVTGDSYDGECSASHCSLCEALASVATTPTVMGLDGAGPIVLTSNGQDVLGTTTIVALGDRVTIDGAGKLQPFRVAGNLTLEHLRLIGGKGQKGGAIYVAAGGQVTASRSSFTGNGAASGGAVASWGVSELINCSLIDNEATSTGDAVSGTGDVTLLHTTLVGNRAPSGSASSSAQLQALNSLLVAPPDADDAVCADPAVDPTGSAATDLRCGATLAADLGPAILIPAGIGTMAAFDLRPSFVSVELGTSAHSVSFVSGSSVVSGKVSPPS